MLIENTFDTGGIKLNYVESGDPDADPIVLLHGLSGRWQAWSQEIGLLDHRYHVHAFDARGHGGSSWPSDHNYDMDLQVSDAARSMAASQVALDPEVWTPHIDGTSMRRFDMDSTLEKVVCPVLLLQADSAMGAALLAGQEERLISLTDDCTHVRFDGVGHGIHKDDPIRFRRVLFDFLDTV